MIKSSGLERNRSEHTVFPLGLPVSAALSWWPESTEHHGVCVTASHPTLDQEALLDPTQLRMEHPAPSSLRVGLDASLRLNALSQGWGVERDTAKALTLFFLKRNQLQRETIKRSAYASFRQFIFILNMKVYIDFPNLSSTANTLPFEY